MAEEAAKIATEAPEVRVERDLGSEAGTAYTDGVRLTKEGAVEGAGERGRAAAAALDSAAATLSTALRNVPEDKQRSAGYAELLLAYGRCLLVYVRRNALAADVFAEGVADGIDVAKLTKAAVESAKAAVDPSSAAKLEESVKHLTNIAEGKAGDGGKLDSTSGGGDAKLPATESGAQDESSVADENARKVGEAAKAESSAVGDSAAANPKPVGSASSPAGDDDADDDDDESEEDKGDREEDKRDGDEDKGDGEENKGDGEENKGDGEENKGDGEESKRDGEERKEDAGGDEESDIAVEELAWEQFEVARTIFQKLGAAYDSRLSAVHEALGDFLAETDGQAEAAGEEYAKAAAAEIRARGSASRLVADLHHRRYLALRRSAPHVAVAAMESAIESFKGFVGSGEGDDEDVETVKLLEQDLDVFKQSLDAHVKKAHGEGLTTVVGFAKDAAAPPSSAVGENGKGADGDEGADGGEVVALQNNAVPSAVTVQPKRRLKPVAVQPTPEEIENGCLAEAPVSKKRKIDPEPL